MSDDDEITADLLKEIEEHIYSAQDRIAHGEYESAAVDFEAAADKARALSLR